MDKDNEEMEVCDAFISDILDCVKKHNIHPDSMFHVFGLIGNMAVETQERLGIKHSQAMSSVVGNFMEGLGMHDISVSVDDENASTH
jgi:hypothetical protein